MQAKLEFELYKKLMEKNKNAKKSISVDIHSKTQKYAGAMQEIDELK